MKSLSCLSHDDVAQYVRGVTFGKRVTAIVWHVERCPGCRERVVAMVRTRRTKALVPLTVEAWLARHAPRRHR